MNRNISLASRDPLPLGREDIYKGMEEIGAYLDVTPRDFQEIYAHAYKIARGRLLSSITAGDIMHVPVLCVAEEQSVRDLVIFLDEGRVVEMGGFQELSQSNGRFAALLRASGILTDEEVRKAHAAEPEAA